LRLEITQYLLLDHSGEYDFLEAVLAEFAAKPGGLPPLIVSYNGKSFDAQILKSKCIVNGISPPGFFHADLLHPARRLWKRVLPACSQGEIETAVLGLDRTGDIPGAMAPDIWFNFLKTGETGDLEGICNHNVKDIFGLARLFHALAVIAGDPLGVHSIYRYDLENLALHWRQACRKQDEYPLYDEEIQRTGNALLTEAAGRGHPRAAFALGRDLFRCGDYEKGRIYLEKAVRGNPALFYSRARAAAYRALAIDAERRLKDRTLALGYSEAALALDTPHAGSGALSPKLREDLTRRRDRLAGKNTAV
jgi:tetratricopeptide (TPR) repeat protein